MKYYSIREYMGWENRNSKTKKLQKLFVWIDNEDVLELTRDFV